MGCLPFKNNFRKIRLESEWNTTFWSFQRKISGSNGACEKPPVFPDAIFHAEIPGGGTWVFFGWVCAARDSKLAPRSRKNVP